MDHRDIFAMDRDDPEDRDDSPYYIELGPDDVIREGDQWSLNHYPDTRFWFTVQNQIGHKVKDVPGSDFRRPRSTFIRDAALELAKEMYRLVDWDERIGATWPQLSKLREALGVTVEELRGE